MNAINQFEKLNPSDIYSKDYPNIKSNLQRITTTLTKIINAIAKEKGATFTPEQKRGLIAAFVKSISTNYIVLPKEAKNKMEGINGESTQKLIDTIKSKIKEYINICNKLNGKGRELGSINNSADFINTIEENINTDILKIRLKEFLGVKKEDKMEKLIELITSNSNKNNSKGKSLIFSIVTSMAGINKTNNSSDTLYYDIISNQFISDICDLIDLCTITKTNSGNIVNVKYKPAQITSVGDGASILNKDNQEKLNEIIQKVVNHRIQVTVS